MVYVDCLIDYGKKKNWRYGKACHLLSYSLEELHRFAFFLGLKRSWFQSGSLPHYDLTEGNRREAVRIGAVDLSPEGKTTEEMKDVYEMLRKIYS